MGLLAVGLVGRSAQAGVAPPAIWRVCVTDVVAPPYLNGDPTHPGLIERLVADAGRQVGFSVLLVHFPVRRCKSMFVAHEIDSMIGPAGMGYESRVPMKGGAVDVSRRIARINLIWVRRAETPYDWDGRRFTGNPLGHPLVIGTRASFFPVQDRLDALGVTVDGAALNTHQALAKLAAKRVDLVLGVQEEIEFGLRDPALVELVVLPRAFQTLDYFALVHPGLDVATQAKVEAWWTAIARMRDQPELRDR